MTVTDLATLGIVGCREAALMRMKHRAVLR